MTGRLNRRAAAGPAAPVRVVHLGSNAHEMAPKETTFASVDELNRDYGPGNSFYEDFCSLVKTGIEEGWAASGELDGRKYRRGKVGWFSYRFHSMPY